MITNFFIPELNNHDVQELWFQQDDATCHTAHATIDLLKDTFEARKLIATHLSQSCALAAKSSAINNSAQTDANILKIKCPPLNLLQSLLSLPKIYTSISTPAVSTSSSTQVHLLPSPFSIAATVLEPQPPLPMPDVLRTTTNNMFNPIEPSSSIMSASSSNSRIQPPSASRTTQDSQQSSRIRARKRKKNA
ncbi:hypothetical protein TNCV_3323821 [Trichonephila clavipes]|nr:hypothetical protein TNCV_3323821 [Trichonephila clavipes]